MPSQPSDFYARCAIEPDSDCIRWTAGYNVFGQPVAYYDHRQWQARRLAYRLHYGHLPRLRLRHTCDEPGDPHRWCVNPLHLVVFGRPGPVADYLASRGDPQPDPSWMQTPLSPSALITSMRVQP